MVIDLKGEECRMTTAFHLANCVLLVCHTIGCLVVPRYASGLLLLPSQILSWQYSKISAFMRLKVINPFVAGYTKKKKLDNLSEQSIWHALKPQQK